jgi:ribosomal protein S18 acetylase RimI-like enzyme
MDPVLTLGDKNDPALEEVIRANFRAHAQAKGLTADFAPLTIHVEQDGVLLGGLVGRTGRGWLYVEFLALPMAGHGGGLGRRLMAMAEAEAVRRGCTGAYLYTNQFQAPGFYEKLGYREFGRLVHENPELTRIWYSKVLP